MSTFLVTGGAGFIGQRVCNQLHERGHKVVVVDDLSGGGKTPPNTQFVYGSVASALLWNSLVPVDAVIHLAASFANYRSVLHPVLDMRCNIEGTIQAALFARERGIPLIYAGSSSSYGKAMYVGKDLQPFKETYRGNPSTPYALSKQTGEDYALMLCPQVTSLRLFNVFGPGDYPGEFRNAIPNMVARGRATKVIEVFGEDAARDFTPVHLVARAFCDAAVAMVEKKPFPRVMNVCSGTETRMGYIANYIVEQLGGGMTYEVKPARLWDEVPRRVGSTKLLHTVFPWLQISAEEFRVCLDTTLTWLNHQRDAL